MEEVDWNKMEKKDRKGGITKIERRKDIGIQNNYNYNKTWIQFNKI